MIVFKDKVFRSTNANLEITFIAPTMADTLQLPRILCLHGMLFTIHLNRVPSS
jgi:hypothetical protein